MAARQKAVVKSTFESWDLDGNGTISKDELTKVLKKLGNFTELQVDAIITEADTNGNGMIEFDEFINWLLKPQRNMGGAALLSGCDLCLRATAPLADHREPTTVDGDEASWKFAGDFAAAGPVCLVKPAKIDLDYTIAIWVKLVEAGSGQWNPLVGDSLDAWAFSIGISSTGCIGIRDPRNGDAFEKCLQHEALPVDKWILLVARGMCGGKDADGKWVPALATTQKGETEFLVAHDVDVFRQLGSVEAVGSGHVVGEFGGYGGKVAEIASMAVWNRVLADEELRELFIWDSVRFACVDDDEYKWLRLNRRKAEERSEEENEELENRLSKFTGNARSTVLEVSDLKIVDSDLPLVVDALTRGFDRAHSLVASGNYITEDGVNEYLVPFLASVGATFRLDLRNNPDLGVAVEAPLIRVLSSLPKEWGCSVDARGTKLRGTGLTKLLNQGPWTDNAAMDMAKQRDKVKEMCDEHEGKQAEIVNRWKEEFDDNPPPIEDETLGGESTPFPKFPAGDKEKLKTMRAHLSIAAHKLYDHQQGPKNTWARYLREGASKDSDCPPLCGSAQIMAHLSYHSCSQQPREPDDYGLRLRPKGENLTGPLVAELADDSAEGKAEKMGLHYAVECGKVTIKSASGKGYGSGSLTLELQNATDQPLNIIVPAGAVFEQTRWVHRHNLLVGRTLQVQLEAGETKELKIGAYSMNQQCSSSSDDPMQLTSLLFENKEVLESQAKVWTHFEETFTKHMEEAGFGGKKKGKK
jgi:hypothetical protein